MPRDGSRINMGSPESRGLSQRAARDNTTICCAMGAAASPAVGYFGGRGWVVSACNPGRQSLASGCCWLPTASERRTRSVRLKALLLPIPLMHHLVLCRCRVEYRPVAQLHPLLKPPPLHIYHASPSSFEAETASRRLRCPFLH